MSWVCTGVLEGINLITSDTNQKKGLYITSGTARKANKIYNTLPDEEKKLVTAEDNAPKHYTNEQERRSYLAKSFVLQHGHEPISLFDIWQEGSGDVAIAIMTKSGEQYRGKGYGAMVVKSGMDWLEQNQSIKNAYWDVKETNAGSIRLAEKNGFIRVSRSDDGWLQYKKQLHV